MQEFWVQLAPRERIAILIGAGVLTVILLYLLAWTPFVERAQRLETSVQERRATQQWMKGAVQEAQRLRATSTPTSGSTHGGQSLLALIDQSARAQGLASALKRVEPDGENSVRVWLERAPFDDMLTWLGGLRQQQGVRISSITVDEQGGPGLVSARLVVEGVAAP